MIKAKEVVEISEKEQVELLGFFLNLGEIVEVNMGRHLIVVSEDNYYSRDLLSKLVHYCEKKGLFYRIECGNFRVEMDQKTILRDKYVDEEILK